MLFKDSSGIIWNIRVFWGDIKSSKNIFSCIFARFISKLCFFRGYLNIMAKKLIEWKIRMIYIEKNSCFSSGFKTELKRRKANINWHTGIGFTLCKLYLQHRLQTWLFEPLIDGYFCLPNGLGTYLSCWECCRINNMNFNKIWVRKKQQRTKRIL